MKLGGDEVRAIAAEARLSLADAELAGNVNHIDKFLDMVGRLKELDLNGVEPFCFTENFECPLREDTPAVFDEAEEIVAERMGSREGPFFKVPRILEE